MHQQVQQVNPGQMIRQHQQPGVSGGMQMQHQQVQQRFVRPPIMVQQNHHMVLQFLQRINFISMSYPVYGLC